MRQLNVKILLAPLLAVALVLLIAGAITSLPFKFPDEVNIQASPPPTATAHGTPLPQAAASMVASPLPIYLIGGAILVCIIAALLFFREKDINKES